MRKIVRILPRKSRAAAYRTCAQGTVTCDTCCDGRWIRIDASILNLRWELRVTDTSETKKSRNRNQSQAVA
jgi:hypothetical protein